MESLPFSGVTRKGLVDNKYNLGAKISLQRNTKFRFLPRQYQLLLLPVPFLCMNNIKKDAKEEDSNEFKND